MPALPQPTLTPEEYLARERVAETKSEYVNGRVYAMAAASREHNRIVLNIGSELRAQLRGRPCEAFVNDLRLKVSPTGLYTYPDVMAICGEPRFEDRQVDTLLNPSLVIEVLSDSTERYDRGEKFAHYRRLESLREYVLVAQDRMQIERYVREGDEWRLTVVGEPNDTLELPSIGCVLRLAEVYERVEFGEAGEV